MNRTPLIRLALAAAIATLAFPVAGENTLEIIGLRYRTVDQVLPALRPLLESGATVSGQSNQLIVRTSPVNLADLKRALKVIDRPLRRLQISVRFDAALDAGSLGVEASGRVSRRSARVEVRGQDRRTSAEERVDQRIQVLEGGRAFIMMGSAAPVAVTPQAVVIRETGTGFEAVPRLSGDTVLLDVAPRRETAGQQQYLATTVSARLGEWFEVGGTESRRVWLKVEEIRP
jgi:type II secretory pathway component GspD/PulD (secretin)